MFLKLSIIAAGFIGFSNASLMLDYSFTKNIKYCALNMQKNIDISDNDFTKCVINSTELECRDNSLLEIYRDMSNVLTKDLCKDYEKNIPFVKKLFEIASRIEDYLVINNMYPDYLTKKSAELAKRYANILDHEND